LLIWWDMRV